MTNGIQSLYSSVNHKVGFTNYIDGINQSSYSFTVAEIAKNHQGLLVSLITDAGELDNIRDEIEYFLSGENIPVVTFPDWETLPYDYFSPHQDIISQRLRALYHLPQMHKGVLLLPVTSALQKLSDKSFIQLNCHEFITGKQLQLTQLRKQLVENGYNQVDNVVTHGEFAVRGSIVDLYPSSLNEPVRIELFDDEIESLRLFNPDSQLSTQKIEQFSLLPAREFPVDEAAISLFRQQWRAKFDVNIREASIYNEVSQGHFPPGIEYYLPLFFKQTSHIFDFISHQDCLLVTEQNIQQTINDYWQELAERHEQYRHDTDRPILEPDLLFLKPEELNQHLKQFVQVHINRSSDSSFVPHADKTINSALKALSNIQTDAKNNQFLNLKTMIADADKTLICADSHGRQQVLQELIIKQGVKTVAVNSWKDFEQQNQGVYLTVAPLVKGFAFDDCQIITESDLFGHHVLQRKQEATAANLSPDQLIHSLAELKIGDPVVHIHQGVGRYLGLETLASGGFENDYLTLEYAGGDKLYVPAQSLSMIHRYAGSSPETAPWHKLGSDSWKKSKEKAVKQARDTAAELLDLYAKRNAVKGVAHSCEHDEYLTFTNQFEYEPTPDQHTVFKAVYEDMTNPRPMDRLVCGDVGFGKTEVAMRAAFIAVQSGFQVAILVPTTLLAQQHHESFTNRFANWPVKIEVLSRFQSKKQQTATEESLGNGQTDIVIATHKLINSKPKFKNLGLLIIDEEHRFGVRQKEVLKSYKNKVDILALTATPIPRTLNMSMSGLRDLSIIATPPAKRLSIKTFVRQYHEPLISEAVQREIRRGGQVYFLHNSVDTIEQMADNLRQLLPNLNIGVAHGQMREKELESVMRQFYRHQFHILVCTTIIETGIDIPTANTIIINRADKLGLAQLHQLRGRVGRSHHQAYAYLLTPHPKSMTKDAGRRLEAIENLEDLGAGFILATHDLEIRGAGEILGDEQSGHMQTIGFSMYVELIERAIKSLKEGKTASLEQTFDTQTEVSLGESALLPDSYIGDVGIRLSLYKRIANAADGDQLRELQVELIDRFGLLPQEAKNLFVVTELKLKILPMGIIKLEADNKGIQIEFNASPDINTEKLIKLLQTEPTKYRLANNTKLKVVDSNHDIVERIQKIEQLIELLT